MRLHNRTNSPNPLFRKEGVDAQAAGGVKKRGKMQLLPFEKGGREGFVYVARGFSPAGSDPEGSRYEGSSSLAPRELVGALGSAPSREGVRMTNWDLCDCAVKVQKVQGYFPAGGSGVSPDSPPVPPRLGARGLIQT